MNAVVRIFPYSIVNVVEIYYYDKNEKKNQIQLIFLPNP